MQYRPPRSPTGNPPLPFGCNPGVTKDALPRRLSPDNPGAAGSRRGFTLIEMLIAMIIIGILAAITVPRLDTSKGRAKAAALRLGTTLLAVQREAIGKQHQMVVMIDPAGRRLRILDDSTNDGTWNNNERVRSVEIGDGIAFGRPANVTARLFGSAAVSFTNVEPTTGLPAIVFYRNGSTQEYGGLYISSPKALSGATSEGIWAVEITRATGRAEWYNWNGTSWKRGF